MKLQFIYLAAILLINTTLFGQSLTVDFLNKVDRFLSTYVEDGRVDYSSIKINNDQLFELTDFLENFDLSRLKDKDAQKAFWINVYNITVIKSVIQNYPISSPLDVDGFFNKNKHIIGKMELTLDQIEKEILFGIDRDPRLHFAVVCAAVGCPQIINKAYRINDLNDMLNNRAVIAVNNDYYVNVDTKNKVVHLNEIFKWYRSDFEQGYLTVISFINKYRNVNIPSDYSIEYINYDWKLNDLKIYKNKETGLIDLQSYTPSVLLAKGEYELKVFNNLYTQTAYFDENLDKIDQNGRSTYNTILTSFLYGITEDINLGFDVWIKSVRNDIQSSSPLEVFGFNNSLTSRNAISGIGPKIKISPFSSGFFEKLSIQSTFLIPTETNLTGSSTQPYLDSDSYLFLNQFFYDEKFSEDFSFFGELDFWFRIDRNLEGRNNSFQIPVKGFLSYYPSNNLTLYYMLELSTKFGEGPTNSYYSQTGVGLKYQLLPWLELEGLGTIFYIGKNSGAGQTLNFGIRIVNAI